MDEAVETQDTRGQWFVVQTLSGHENKVRDTINRQLRMGDQVPVYEAMIPVEKVMEIRNGKKVQITRKFFPGYILVRMDLYVNGAVNEDGQSAIDEKAWYFVRNVQGVLGFLGGANRPTPLTDAEFRDMNPTIGEDAPPPTLLIGVKVGDIVRVKDGPFMGCEGNVRSIDDTHGRLTIEALVFGHLTPVENLEFWQVEPVV